LHVSHWEIGKKWKVESGKFEVLLNFPLSILH